MRQIALVFSLILCLAVSTGCMVLDEIDKAGAKMPPPAKKQDAAKLETATPGADAGAAHLLEESKRWWTQATSLAPNGVDSSIVKCRLGRATEFRSRDDCLGRGGVPQGVSG